MQVIQTRYIGASNTKSSRIKAQASGGASVTISYPHEAPSVDAAHAAAADALRIKLGWDAMFLAGHTERGAVFAFVIPHSDTLRIG